MARGTSLTATLPTVGVTAGPTYATLVNAWMTELEAAWAVKIVPSELNMNAALDMNSQDVDDCNTVKLDNQGSEVTGAGNAYRLNAFNGELYFCDGSGTSVKITDGGVLSGVSGDIGGDYGDSNEEITYSAANNTYVFTDDDTNKAIIDCKEIKHEEHTLVMFPQVGYSRDVAGTANDWYQLWASGDVRCVNPAAPEHLLVSIPLLVGDRIKGVDVSMASNVAGTVSLDYVEDGVVTNVSSGTSGTAGTFADSVTITGLSHTVLEAGYVVSILPGAGAGTTRVSRVSVTFDRI
jgi:hypothetical protein